MVPGFQKPWGRLSARQLDAELNVGGLTRPVYSQGQDIAGREMELIKAKILTLVVAPVFTGMKSYTAGAIDPDTGDFTAAAEKQPGNEKIRAWHRGYVPPSG